MTEIISYMAYQYQNQIYHDINQAMSVLESEYKKVQPLSIDYPSSYRHNVLVMLAKRLIQEEKTLNACQHKNHLHNQRLKRLTSS